MEHHLAKVGVAGSIPVSRFFFCAILGTGIGDSALFSFHAAFSKIFNLIMMITDISAIMGHKNSF